MLAAVHFYYFYGATEEIEQCSPHLKFRNLSLDTRKDSP
jgi:hypothetical protein